MSSKNQPYNRAELILEPVLMAVARNASSDNFGQRLAAFRRARGLSQRQLATRLGISGRMVAYYEKETDRPPAHLLDKLSHILAVSTDELLGVKAPPVEDPGISTRLWKRLRQIEQLPPDQRKAILKILDGLLDSQRPRAPASMRRR